MLDLLTVPQAQLFFVALAITGCLVAIEVLLLSVGLAGVEFLDAVLPDGVGDVDLDLGAEHGFHVDVLNWLYIGRVPFLVLLMAFLGAFGVSGLALINRVVDIWAVVPPVSITAPLALLIALPIVHFFGALVHRLVPGVSTAAVSLEELEGLTGTITLGDASDDLAAEARVEDRFGRDHYVNVKPQDPGERIPQGSQVCLSSYAGDRLYFVTPLSHQN